MVVKNLFIMPGEFVKHWVGAMRQAGIIASAGMYSLDNMLDQIREDHKNTTLLAEGINEIEGLSIDSESIKSNILYFDIEKGAKRCEKLARQTKNITVYPFQIALDNIRFFESHPNRFRLVTHYGITGDDIEKTLGVLDKIVN